jgi:hypothetical protein
MKLETTIELLNGEQPLIHLQDIEVFDDGSGARCLLTINSNHFSCTSFPFYFEDLKDFCKSIKRMYKELKGNARLSLSYEPGFIELEMDKLGHVNVHGLVIGHGLGQELRFRFQTDQTCLSSMVQTSDEALKEMS